MQSTISRNSSSKSFWDKHHEVFENANAISPWKKRKEEIEKAFFGVLYTMIRLSEGYNKLAILRVIIDFMQLLTFSIINVPWGGTWNNWIAYTIGLLQLPAWITEGFLVIYWLSTLLLCVALADAFFVWTLFRKAKFKYLWAIRTLRFFVSTLVTILFIPFLKVQFMVFSCEVISKHMECWGPIHMIYIIVSSLVLVLFIPLTFLTTMVYYEPDMASKYIMAKPYARIDVIYLFMKTILTLVSVIYSEPWPVVITVMLLSLVMFVLNVVFLPVYRQIINNVIAGGFLVNFWISLGGIICLSIDNESYFYTILFFTLTPAVFILGFGASEARFRLVLWKKRQYQKSLTDDVSLFKFANAVSVEIETRFLRKTTNSDDLHLAEFILDQGIQRFPKSSFLYMLYANFCFGYLYNVKKAYVFLDRIRHLQPSLDTRFYLYRKDMEMKQKRESESLGDEMLDLMSYIDFQNNFKAAKRFHYKARRAIRSFWRLLLDDSVNVTDLPKAFKLIDNAESKAKQYYLKLLERYPKSVRILRAYAEFLEDVLNDIPSADQYYARADFLEDAKSKAPEEEVRPQTSDRSEMEFLTSHTKVGSKDFIVIMDKTCIMRDVNSNSKLFGWKSSDLIGQDINMLIPEPYKKNHTSYVNRHLATGVTKIVGVGSRRLPIVQKNGSLAAILLSVTKVSVGADFMFVGIIQKVQEGIIATNKDGVILYTTDIIEQLFGFAETELKGENISKLITGNAVPKDSEIENFVYQYTSENSVNLVKMVGSGQATVPIKTKAEHALTVKADVTVNGVDGNLVFTWWILPEFEEQQSDPSLVPDLDLEEEPFSDSSSEHSVSSARRYRKAQRPRKKQTEHNWKITSAAKKYKRFAITNLSRYMKVSIVALVLLKIAAFVSTILLIESLGTHSIFQSGRRAYDAVQISFDTRSMQRDFMINDTHSFLLDQDDLASIVQDFKVLHYQVSSLKDPWNSPMDIPINYYTSSVNGTTIAATSYVNIIQLGNLIAETAEMLAQTPYATFGLSSSSDLVMFLIGNVDTATTYFSNAVYHAKDLLGKQTVVLFWVEIALLVTALIALVVIGFFLFKPTFHKIHVERNKTLELFLKINKSVVYQMSQGKQNDEEYTKEPKESSLEVELKSVTSEEFINSSAAVSKTNAVTNAQVENKSSFKPGKFVENETKASTSVRLKSALLQRLTIQYILALSFIATAFTPSAVVAWFIATGSVQQQYQVATSSEVLCRTSQLAFKISDVYNTTASEDDYEASKSQMLAMIDHLVHINNDLVFVKGHLSDKHRKYMFEDCVYENESMCNSGSNDDWGSNGLDVYFNHYIDITRLLIQQSYKEFSDVTIAPNYLTWILQNTLTLEVALSKSVDLYVAQSEDFYYNQKVTMVILLLCYFVILLVIYVMGFNSIVSRLNNEAKRTRSMILMIPESVVEDVKEIQAYLAATRNKDEQEDQF